MMLAHAVSQTSNFELVRLMANSQRAVTSTCGYLYVIFGNLLVLVCSDIDEDGAAFWATRTNSVSGQQN